MKTRFSISGLSFLIPGLLFYLYVKSDLPKDTWLLARSLYFFMWFLLSIALMAGGWTLFRIRLNPVTFFRNNYSGLFVALGLSISTMILFPPEMKVQFDESTLSNISQTMHFFRADLMSSQAIADGK